MLRGMATLKMEPGYPWYSVDSASVARNHNSQLWTAEEKITDWDALPGVSWSQFLMWG